SRNRTRYRTKAMNSEVDESLFGVGKSPAGKHNRCESPIVILRDKQSIQKSLGWTHKPETIQLITRDMIRDLVIPSEDPSGESLIISPEEFERIKFASRVLTKEERDAIEEAYKKEKTDILTAVTLRKQVMKQKEMVRRKNRKLSDLEEDAKEREHNLLEKANAMRMEQDVEIKDMSQIIRNARCHAIRDAQILEKQLIQKELDTEEKRLDQMMEMERQKSIQRQEEIDNRRKEERIRGRRHIINQIEKNQEERSLQAEVREQEIQQMLQYMEQLQEEDIKNMEQRHQDKIKMQAEIKRINDENQRRKEELLAQEKLADQLVMEFTKKKMKEKLENYMVEIAQSLPIHMNLPTINYSYPRKWEMRGGTARKWELTKRVSSWLVAGLLPPCETYLCLPLIPRAQRQQIEKERLEEEKKGKENLQHANELRRQVRENQQKQVQERIATFEEGRRLKEEAQKRHERINEIKKKKIEELRATGLPEKYCIEAERKGNIHSTESSELSEEAAGPSS
uniref:Cilia- and flagella-associated protein 45 n=1 Tax=Monodelphis domestica TaxID=13616 RepID=A0A5F8GJK4_MONDO